MAPWPMNSWTSYWPSRVPGAIGTAEIMRLSLSNSDPVNDRPRLQDDVDGCAHAAFLDVTRHDLVGANEQGGLGREGLRRERTVARSCHRPGSVGGPRRRSVVRQGHGR